MVYEEGKGVFINPALALVSFGTQVLPLSARAVAGKNQRVIFTWSTEVPAAYNDQSMLVAYEIETQKVSYKAAASPRNSGIATLKLAKEDKGKTFHLYLAFIANDRSAKSNSSYLGSVVII
ncbi:hypothetical protein MASR2M52_08680 [Pedobacter sp.]